jgi:hypothetical protein
MDEFAYFDTASKAGVLHMRDQTDDVVMAVARDGEHISPEFRAVYAFMESVSDSGRPTNALWVTGTALDVAFDRGLIDGEQFDHYRREAGL